MFIQFDSLKNDQVLMNEIFNKDVSDLDDELKKKNGGSKITLNIISEKRP